jgi:hypothetical protein
LSLDIAESREKPSNLVFAGIILSLANLYWTVWWATIGLDYIFFYSESCPVEAGVFFIGHIMAAFSDMGQSQRG